MGVEVRGFCVTEARRKQSRKRSRDEAWWGARHNTTKSKETTIHTLTHPAHQHAHQQTPAHVIHLLSDVGLACDGSIGWTWVVRRGFVSFFPFHGHTTTHLDANLLSKDLTGRLWVSILWSGRWAGILQGLVGLAFSSCLVSYVRLVSSFSPCLTLTISSGCPLRFRYPWIAECQCTVHSCQDE